MKTIRKNATKKITAYLNSAKAIVLRTSRMELDDSHSRKCRAATVAEVLEWLADEHNYSDAQVILRDGESLLQVSGPYHFDDCFYVYLTDEALAQAGTMYQAAAGMETEKPAQHKPTPQPLPANVISMADWLDRKAS